MITPVFPYHPLILAHREVKFMHRQAWSFNDANNQVKREWKRREMAGCCKRFWKLVLHKEMLLSVKSLRIFSFYL